MNSPNLGYSRQLIDADDIDAVVNVLKSDYLTQGPALEAFEQNLALYVGARHAVAVCNGTAALHLACLAASLSEGDVAIVPSLTFAATANAPLYCGARSMLTDIDLVSLCLSPEIVSEALAECPGAAAVLPVAFAGLSEGMADIRKVAGDLVVIEDACHALGGTYEDGTRVGSCAHSDMATFSFHPVKPITTGEGGAITTNDDALARKLRLLRNHGIERDQERFVDPEQDGSDPWHYEQHVLGFNYRMTDFQAALGKQQLAKLDGFLMRRRNIAAYFDDRFANLAHIAIPQSAPAQRARSGLHLYLLQIDFQSLGRTRRDIMAILRGLGIGTQVHYIPVHHHPYHRISDIERAEFPATERHYAGTLSIPFYPSMSDSDVEYVAEKIEAAVS